MAVHYQHYALLVLMSESLSFEQQAII